MEYPPSRKVLLLFDVNCRACDKNWPLWEKLLSDRDLRRLLLPIATSNTVSPEYLEKYHISNGMVFVGLDKELQFLLHLHATPQTILEQNGIVEKVWFGVLSDSDVNEIMDTLKTR